MNQQSEDLKLCAGIYGCGMWKSLGAFTQNRANRDGRQSPCLDCRRRRYQTDSEHRADVLTGMRAAYAADPAKFRRRAWEQKLRRKYGLTPKQWHDMLIEQGGRCAVCCEPMYLPCVDHSHAQKYVRALLCHGCNTRVGALESPLLDVTLVYLDRFRDTATQHPYCLEDA